MGVGRHRFGIALVCVLPTVAASFVGMRLLSRWRRGVKFGWDDWLLVLSVLLSFGLIAPSILTIRMYHFGYHVWEFPQTTEDLTNRDYDQAYAISLSFDLLSIPILPLAKASIIIILLKVGDVMKSVRQAMYAVFVFNAGACIIPWAIFIFRCPQLEGAGWATRTFGNLKCLSHSQQGHLLLFINCANLLTDVVVFPVPFFIMRELLSTSWRSKLTFLLTFASSLSVTALSAVKIYVTLRDRVRLIDNPDWMYSLVFCITHAEGNVGIIVACVPTLRGLISRNSSSKRSGSGPENGYPSFTPSNNYTSITVGRMSGRSWSRSSRPHDSEHLLDLSSDIFMTTMVKTKSSPTDDSRGLTFGREIFERHEFGGHGPRNIHDHDGDDKRNRSMDLSVESGQREHVPPSPLLPPPPHVRYH